VRQCGSAAVRQCGSAAVRLYGRYGGLSGARGTAWGLISGTVVRLWPVGRALLTLTLALLVAASALPAAAQTPTDPVVAQTPTDPAAAQTVPATAQTDPAAAQADRGVAQADPGAAHTTGPGVANSPPLAADGTCDATVRPPPLPAPGTPRPPDFFRSFREPLAPAPLYDPPGAARRVGLQAGHWLNDQVPPELGRLQGGAVGGGKQEWEVNLDIAQRTAALLSASGIEVDVLPATVPEAYRANAFIALHSDGDPSGAGHGFKVARPGFSSLPDVDDHLVDVLNRVYGADTELPRDDDHISLRMRYYYAFNSRRYCHSVAPGVPQAIVEMGYLTSPIDRQFLLGDPDRLARGLSDSIQVFLGSLP
jgi:N-acetylmuramoyl-L-alanine amidase